jgi:hypothetical protein
MKRVAMLSLVGCLIFASRGAAVSAEAEHDFAKWEKAIAAYEQTDRTNRPPKGALLFIGSSTIRLWKTLAQDFPEQRVINRGSGGSEIVDSSHCGSPHAPSPGAPRPRGPAASRHARRTAGPQFV